VADENAPRNQYSKDKANVDQLKAMQAVGISPTVELGANKELADANGCG
jgi:hypothetical protein